MPPLPFLPSLPGAVSQFGLRSATKLARANLAKSVFFLNPPPPTCACARGHSRPSANFMAAQLLTRMRMVKGGFLYVVRKNLGFFTPFPLVMYINQLILFLSSAFRGPPSPHPLRTSYMEAPKDDVRWTTGRAGGRPIFSHKTLFAIVADAAIPHHRGPSLPRSAPLRHRRCSQVANRGQPRQAKRPDRASVASEG